MTWNILCAGLGLLAGWVGCLTLMVTRSYAENRTPTGFSETDNDPIALSDETVYLRHCLHCNRLYITECQTQITDSKDDICPFCLSNSPITITDKTLYLTT